MPDRSMLGCLVALVLIAGVGVAVFLLLSPDSGASGPATLPGETGDVTSGNLLGPEGFANREFLDPDAEPGGRLAGYTQAFSGNVNYLVNNEATVGDLWNLCNDSLATRNYQDVLRFEPVLAEGWEVSDDGLVYTIRLRQGALWHPYTDPVTGREVPATEVTADDFLFFWEVLQNPNLPVDPLRVYYESCTGIEKIDRYTIRITWTEPYSLAREFTLGMTPLPRHFYRPDPETTDEAFVEQFLSSQRNQLIVGCGPYRFTEWRKGEGVLLERFDDYYGALPPVRYRIIREIKNPTTALLELEGGRLDRIGLLPEQWVRETLEPKYVTVAADLDSVSEDAAAFNASKAAGELPPGVPGSYTFEKYLYPSFSWVYMGYNMRKPLFADRRVRLALTHCIDRRRIIREVYHNLREVLTGPFPVVSPYYNHEVEPWPYDPDRAREILAEAGWEDTDGDGWLDKDLDGDGTREPFAFNFLMIASSTTLEKWVPMLQEDLRKVGIRLTINPTEWAVYTEKLDQRSFDVCALAWSGGIESDPFQIWHSSQADIPGSSNHVGYTSAEADALIEEGRRTLDPEARVAIYRKFHALLHEDQPYTFLFSVNSLVAQHRRYRNVRIFPLGMNTNQFWVPSAEQREAVF